MHGPTAIMKTAFMAMAISLSACASIIDPVDDTVVDLNAAAPTRATWAEPAPEALPQADWVESFSDDSLNALVAKARADNPSLRRTMAQLDRAIAAKNSSRSSLYPTLGGDASSTRSEGGTGFNSGSTSYGLGVSSRWEVDVINRIRDQIAADGEGVEASAADIAALELTVVSRLASGWFDAIEAGLLVELSAEEIRTQERSLRLTQRRFESGLTGSSDVRLARSSIANAQALEQSRLQLRDATLRSIQTLVRDYPDADVALPSDLPALPVFTGAGTPENMLARRPDILASERRIVQAGLNVDVARKALYPSLSITGSAGDESLNSIGDVLDLKSLAFSLTESLTAPIFQGGRLRAQVETQKAQLASQVETYAETVLTAYQEVENALDAEKRLEAREAALRVSRDEAVKAEERLELRYTEGLATILQLLDAQSRRISADGQLISARAERLSNRVRLHVALGGAGYVAPLNLQDSDPVKILGIELP
ncbi:efflux transporter outer membrane subunit [Algimonas arctica]|nr:efflux transporter outer membrane subunit [Algimonas arctica]